MALRIEQLDIKSVAKVFVTQAEIQSLTEKTNELIEKLPELDSSITQSNTNAKDIVEINKNITSINQSITNVNSSIKQNSDKIATNESSISNNTNSLNSLNTTVSNLNEELVQSKNQIQNNTSNITINTKNITKNTNSIATTNSNIETLHEGLIELEDKVNNIKVSRTDILTTISNLTEAETKALGIIKLPTVKPDIISSFGNVDYSAEIVTISGVVNESTRFISVQVVNSSNTSIYNSMCPSVNNNFSITFKQPSGDNGNCTYTVIPYGIVENGIGESGLYDFNPTATEDGIEYDGKWYGESAPKKPELEWVKGAFVKEKYWVSMFSIPQEILINGKPYIWVQGVKVGSNIVTNTSNIPNDLGLEQTRGVCWKGTYFGPNNIASQLANVLKENIQYSQGTFEDQSIPELSCLWDGNSNIITEPQYINDYDSVFHIKGIIK